ncbi:MAG: hypothetical protein GY803_11725 [Chloroflexi bacterium]|nr:hypothetical protein [Chloroflexota bacterium]
MKSYGKTTVSEFLGDNIVYRNLEPVDERLPSLDDLREKVGLADGRMPRKSESDYAQVIVHMLRQAREFDTPGTEIKRLIFVGDTRLNDGLAFANICQAGGWPGIAFIGAENSKPAQVEIAPTDTGETLYLSNRWAEMADFDAYLAEHEFVVDEETAVVLDLDKTSLGARGRNDGVINRARVTAVFNTVAELLGADFDAPQFQTDYDRLNQVQFHPFTTDNQDYLAYICLIFGTGLTSMDNVERDVKNGSLTNFVQFISAIDAQAAQLPAALLPIHQDIYANVQAGDPTPFKAFRRNEFVATIGSMGQQPDDAPVADLIANDILITQEVRALALEWQSRGALLFALSDKPDEASLPTPELAAQGYQPIHRTPTHAVGS